MFYPSCYGKRDVIAITFPQRDMLKKLESDGVSKPVKLMTQQLLERAVILPVLIDPSCMKYVIFVLPVRLILCSLLIYCRC